MRIAIELDHQLFLGTIKVDNVAIYADLPPELAPQQLPSLKTLPEHRFRRRRLIPQAFPELLL
jgi:hypothetical protein